MAKRDRRSNMDPVTPVEPVESEVVSTASGDAPPPVEEDVTVPGVEPVSSEAVAEVVDSSPTLPEPSPEEIAEAAAKAEAEIAEAKAREEAEAAEAARLAEEARLENERRQAAAALQAQVDACKNVLRSYFNNVRRTSKEDAVEWLERMHNTPVNVSEAAFDAIVAEKGFGRETVKRPKSIEVQVEEFFLKSSAT